MSRTKRNHTRDKPKRRDFEPHADPIPLLSEEFLTKKGHSQGLYRMRARRRKD